MNIVSDFSKEIQSFWKGEQKVKAKYCVILQLWSTHFRTGGARGTNQTPLNCLKITGASKRPECQDTFLQLHITSQTSLYMENVWPWIADHNLDYPDHSQIDIFNARTILVERQAQTESAYYQSEPPAPEPFTSLASWTDPVFDSCSINDNTCAKGYGIDITNGKNIYIYNAGLYSFFQNWNTSCIGTPTDSYCQKAMFRIQGNTQNVYI
ncbi:unnamed protein product [Adineta steineri]|uniref:Uncharacterized protein n=1 Tax=Adineta steineri TaxID=433720 RepID=A0A819E2B9_9BILA|nr:unnamed protein product [Adineta steineri]